MPTRSFAFAVKSGRSFAIAVAAISASKVRVPDPAPSRDACIAATALVHGLVVATGNVADFGRFARLAVHDPWER
jgi:toxin FitB